MKTQIVFFLFVIVVKMNGQVIDESKSFYTARLNDSKAVYLEKKSFDVYADGIHDDAPAIQKAINAVQEQSGGRGIVFIPEGIYRIANTVNLWVGIKLIGYGKNRPVIILGKNSPAFQEGENRYMIRFCDRRTSDGEPVKDGTPGTMFSGISNIDLKIEDGNPAAIAVRFHVAQHSFLTHINFNIGTALAAIEEAGNEIRNCNFYGGELAIKTGLPSAGWQVMVIDCKFEGQRNVAIETKDAGMTVIRCHFKNMPDCITTKIGDNDKIFIKDSWFENISGSAINIGNYYDPRTQLNIDNSEFINVPVSVNFSVLPGVSVSVPRDSLRLKTNGQVQLIRNLSHGLHVEDNGSKEPLRKFNTIKEYTSLSSPGEFPRTDIPVFPQQQTWVNIIDLGARGDGNTDDTRVFQKAIEQYDAIYIPMGNYIISETLVLKGQTALIGLQPGLTRFVLKDSTKGFTDMANPKPLIITPSKGNNIITGISIVLGINQGVIGIKWLAGSKSFLYDVNFPGGFSGQRGPATSQTSPAGRGGQFSGQRGPTRGEGQYYAVWVTDGGGGVFMSSWLPTSPAKNGFYVSNTTTPGNTYMLSIEHHKDVEVKLSNVQNWNFYSLQTEEDLGSEDAYAVIIEECKNVNFVNLYCYRRAGLAKPFISAIKIKNSNNLLFKGIHTFSSGPFPYDNSVFIEDSGALIRDHELARFDFK